MFGVTEWDTSEFTPQEKAAYSEAMRIARRSEIVRQTGWTFSELDDQRVDDVAGFREYVDIRSAVLQEKQSLARHGPDGGGGGRMH